MIPIADAQALSFTTPLFGVLLASLFLGEALHRHRIIAVSVGFLGALVILRPGFETVGLGGILVLLSSLSAAISAKISPNTWPNPKPAKTFRQSASTSQAKWHTGENGKPCARSSAPTARQPISLVPSPLKNDPAEQARHKNESLKAGWPKIL